MIRSKEFAKKRLMFIQKEDYNYLAFNLLIILKKLDCTNESKKFKDFKRIAYLIEFMTTTKDIKNYYSIELSNIYLRAQLKKKLLSHLILILKNKGIIEVSANSKYRTLDIWINLDMAPKCFFDKEYFQREFANLEMIKTYTKLTKVSLIKTLVDDLFTNRGVSTWEI